MCEISDCIARLLCYTINTDTLTSFHITYRVGHSRPVTHRWREKVESLSISSFIMANFILTGHRLMLFPLPPSDFPFYLIYTCSSYPALAVLFVDLFALHLDHLCKETWKIYFCISSIININEYHSQGCPLDV